jgi:hypothetical protein
MPYVSVHVDADDLIDDIDTDTLRKEVMKRAAKGDCGTTTASMDVGLNDPEEILEALRNLATAIHTGQPADRVHALTMAACEAAGHSPLAPPPRIPA